VVIAPERVDAELPFHPVRIGPEALREELKDAVREGVTGATGLIGFHIAITLPRYRTM
jgi:hypothetical protein